MCNKEPYALCEGCNRPACEEHFTKALCDCCMDEVEAMTEDEQEQLNQEIIAMLERGELP